MAGTVESCSATALDINIRVHAAVTVDNFDSSDNLCFRIVSAVSIRGGKNIWTENNLIKCPHLHSVCSCAGGGQTALTQRSVEFDAIISQSNSLFQDVTFISFLC